MPKDWHDVNEPNVWKKNTEGGSTQTTEPAEETSTAPKQEPKVFLKNGRFEPGPDGYAFTKKVKVKVDVEEEGNQGEKTKGLVTFKLFSRYKGKEMNHNHEVDVGIHDGVAEAELTLYYDEAYYDDRMPPDEIVEYFFRASHKRCSEVLESKVLSLPEIGGKLRISLHIDPEDETAQNDKFTLRSTDEARTYEQTLTVKDDCDSSNDTLDLIFEGVDSSLSYTLEADHGEGAEPELLFENVSYEELSQDA